MKITMKSRYYAYNRDGVCEVSVTANGKTKVLSFYDGEPEDNNLSRNFSSAYLIPDFVKFVVDNLDPNENIEIVEESFDED